MGKSGIHDFDRSKLVISARNAGFTGNQLANLLRNRYHLELEMAGKLWIGADFNIRYRRRVFEAF